jgi:hypothetical protein
LSFSAVLATLALDWISIAADMRLLAEVSLISDFHLMHLRVTLAGTVLGRTRRRDQRSVYDSADLQDQFVFLKKIIERGKRHP